MASDFGFQGPVPTTFLRSDATSPRLSSEPLRGVLARIRELIVAQGAPVVLVSGGCGAGKTRLAHSACRRLVAGEEPGSAPLQLTFVADPRHPWPWPELCAAVADQPTSEQQVFSHASLFAARRQGGPIVLLIDDAQHISSETLTELLRCEKGDPIVHFVLLADLGNTRDVASVPLLAWLDAVGVPELELSVRDRSRLFEALVAGRAVGVDEV